jgi:hypothetical protein
LAAPMVASRYCFPLTKNENGKLLGGAKSPGALATLCAKNVLLDPLALVTTTGTFPVCVSSGTATFTWPRLMKFTKAGLPFTVTDTPPSWVGALFPTKSSGKIH